MKVERALLPRVLIVEDETLIAEVIEAVLESRYHVTAVNDGLKALDRILGTDYDLILCDLILPEMDGIALFHEIKRQRPGMEERMLFITGYMDQRLRDFLAKQGRLLLVKPFSLFELLEVVDNMASIRQIDRSRASGAITEGAKGSGQGSARSTWASLDAERNANRAGHFMPA